MRWPWLRWMVYRANADKRRAVTIRFLCQCIFINATQLVFINLQHFVNVNDPHAWRVFNCVCQCTRQPSRPARTVHQQTIELHHEIVKFTRNCRWRGAATHIFGAMVRMQRGPGTRALVEFASGMMKMPFCYFCWCCCARPFPNSSAPLTPFVSCYANAITFIIVGVRD